MFYFVLLAGFFLLIIIICSERKINLHQRKKLPSSVLYHYLVEKKRLLFENVNMIMFFLFGGKPYNIKKAKAGFCAISFLVCLLLVNHYWFKFDMLFFLTVTLLTEIMMLLKMAKSRRKKEFEAGFMEVLSTLTASVMAGSSIHQALHRCGETISGPVGEEFSRINRRLNVGEDPEHVLLDAWSRFRYDEFYYFIMIILMSIQRGGQLKVLISRLSRVLMDNKAMENKKKAMTSEARSSSKIVAAIPLLFFMGMKFIMPENYDFVITDPLGNYVLYYVITSEVLGLFIIWLLIKRAT